MARRDVLSRLADAGEEAITRLAVTPGADRVLGAMNAMRDRIDELQRRVRGLDDLERRVEALERRLDAVSPTAGAPALARGDRPTPPSTNVSGGTPRRPAAPAEPTAPVEAGTPGETATPPQPAPPAATPPPPVPPVPPAATLPPTVGGSTEPTGGASPG